MNCSCRPWTITSSETARELTSAEAMRLAHYDVYMVGYKAGRESLVELLKEAQVIVCLTGGARYESVRDWFERVKKELDR